MTQNKTVPTIAITPETADADESFSNIEDALTDIEELDMEASTESKPMKRVTRSNLKIKLTDSGGATDLEDLEASNSEDDKEGTKSAKTVALKDIQLESATTEETCKIEAKGKKRKVCHSVAVNLDEKRLLVAEDEALQGATDLEDFNASDDDKINYATPEIDLSTEYYQFNDIQEVSERFREKLNLDVSPCVTPVPSDEPQKSLQMKKKCKRIKRKSAVESMPRDLSDSDEDYDKNFKGFALKKSNNLSVGFTQEPLTDIEDVETESIKPTSPTEVTPDYLQQNYGNESVVPRDEPFGLFIVPEEVIPTDVESLSDADELYENYLSRDIPAFEIPEVDSCVVLSKDKLVDEAKKMLSVGEASGGKTDTEDIDDVSDVEEPKSFLQVSKPDFGEDTDSEVSEEVKKQTIALARNLDLPKSNEDALTDVEDVVLSDEEGNNPKNKRSFSVDLSGDKITVTVNQWDQDFKLKLKNCEVNYGTGWDAERKGPMSPKGAALTEEAMQKGKPTSTTKPLTETKQVSLDNALDAQVVDKGKKPISRESSKEDLSKSDDRKPKKGFFGAIKTFVAKSLESDSESESSSKSPKKQRKEKKKKSKSVDVVPEEAPPRPPRKPKLPTPTQERKEYADIPFATTPDNLDEELETVEEKARQIVSEVISESEQTTNKIKEKKAPLSVEEVIIEKHFQPVVIETEEISVVVDPTKKEPEKKVIETFTVNLDQSIEGIEKELLEEPPILPEETILKPVVDLDAPLRPPRTKHIYEEIEEPVVSQPPDHLVTEPLYIEEDIENIKKITTNLISNEQNFEGCIDVKQHDQPKEVVSELATEKKKKKEKGFFSFLGKKPSKDTYESDDDSKQEIIEKQDKEMSKEKSIEVKEKKKQESEDESEESKKGGFLGLFAKKPKKEDSKSLEQVQLSPEVLKNMEDSSKFLKDEVANYETGPVVKSAVDVVEDIQETIEVKELPKIAKDERDKTPEKKLKKKVSDDESEESKKGFLGLFGKKSKKEETKSDKTDDTVKFLNGETENYETGLVEQKTIVEPSAITEEIKKETVEITTKDKIKSPEKKLKKRDESEDESEEGKKSGLLGLFGKKSKKEEVKPVRIELSSEVKKDMDDSNNFLSVEIENYETGLVAPNAVTEPSEIKDEIKKETVEITKKEKAKSPEKKLKKRDESEDESEEGKKSGLLGLFGKKAKKEEVKPVKIELSSEVKKDMDDSNKFLNLEIENYESGRVEHKIVTEPTVITEEIKKETVVIIKKEKAKSPEKKLKKRDESEDESEEGKKSGLLSLFAKKTKKEEVKPVKIELSSEVKTDVEDTNKFLNLEIENYETGPVEHQFITEPSVTTEEIKKETVEITKKEKAKSPEKKLKKRDESEDESEEGKKSGLLGLFGKKTKKEEVKSVKIELSSEVKKDIDDSNKFLSTEIENYETGPVEKIVNASEEIMKMEIVEKIEKPQKKERTKSPEKKLKKRDESEEEKTGLLSFFSKKPKKEEEVKVVELSPEVLQNMKATNEFLNGEVENYETGPVIKREEAQKLGETKIFGKKEHKMSPEKKLKKREESEDESDESKKTSLFGLFGKKHKKEEVKPEKVEEDSTKFLNGEKAKYETDLVGKAESIVKSEKVNVETSKEVTKSVEKKAEVEKLILSKELLSNMEDSTNFLKTERDNYESGPVIKKTEITPLAAATEPEKVSKEQKKERTKSPEKKPKNKEETEEQKEEAKRKGLLGLFGKKPKKEDVKSIKTEMSPQLLQDMEDSTKFLNGEVENYESGPVEKKLEAPVEAEIGETKVVSELQETAKPTKKERTKSPEKKIKKVDDKSEDESGESKGILGFFGKKQKKEELKAEKQEHSQELLQNMQNTTDFLLTEVKNYESGPVEKKPVIEEVTKTVRIEETPKLAEKTKSKSLERKKKEESVDEDEEHKKGGFLGLFGKKSKKEEPQTLPESVKLSEEVLQHMEDSKSFLTDEVKNYESGPIEKTDSPKASEVIVETKKSTKASETPKLSKREKSKSLERQRKGDSEDEGDESKKPGFLGLFTRKSKKEEVHEKVEDTEDLLKSIEDSKLFLNQEISNYETGLVEKKHKIRSERPLSEEVKITETTPKMQQKREKSKSLERTKKDETGDESDGKKASFLALFGRKTKKQEQPQKIILSDELLKSMDDTKLFLTEEIKNYETGPVEKKVIQETEIVVASAPIQEETKKTPKLSKKEKSKSLDRKKLQESEDEGEESKQVGFLERFGIKTKKAETTQEIADTSEEILKLKEESKTFLSEEVRKYESGPVEKKLSEGPEEIIKKEQKAQKTEKVTIPFFKERSKSPEKKLKKTDVSDDEGESRTKGGLLGLFAKKTTKEEVTHEPSEELKKNMSQTTDFLKTEIANYETGLYIKPSIHKVETEIIPTKEAPKSEQPQDDSTQKKSKESPKKKEKKLKKKQESDDESEEKKVGFLGLFGKKSKKEEPKEIELSKEVIENMSNTTDFLRLEVENYESGSLIIKSVKAIEIEVPIEDSKEVEFKVKEEPEVHAEKVAKADKESKKHPEVVEESDESKKVGFFGLFGKKQKKDTVKETPKTELSEEVLQNMKDTTDFLQVEVKNYESGPVDKKIVEPETVQTETVTTVEEVSKDKIKKRDKKGKKREDSEDESEDRKSGFFGLFGKKPKKEEVKVETKDKATESQKKEDEKEVSSKQKAEVLKPEKREKSPEKEATKKQESEDEMTKKSLLGISGKKGTKEEENELKADKPETVTDAQPQQVVSESTITQQEFEKYDIPAPVAEEIFEGLVATSGPAVVEHTRKVIVSTKETVGEVDHIPDEFLDQIQDGETLKSELHTRVFEKEIVIQKEIITKDNEIVKKEITIKESLPVGEGDFVREEVTVSKSDEPKPQDLFAASLKQTEKFLSTEIKNFDDVIQRKPVKEPVEQNVEKTTEETPKSKSKKLKTDEKSVASESEEKKGLFGLFGKKSKQEEEKIKSTKQPISETKVESIDETKGFLDEEVKRHDDVYASKTVEKEEAAPAKQPEEKSEPTVEQKKGFFGLFSKKQKTQDHEDKKPQTEETTVEPVQESEIIKPSSIMPDSKLPKQELVSFTNSFIDEERKQYEGMGITRCKPVVEAQAPIETKTGILGTLKKKFRLSSESGGEEIEEKIEETAVKAAEVAKESRQRKKSGSPFRIFAKRTKSQEREIKSPETELEDTKKQISETDNFLNEEISGYHDVRPTSIDLSKIKDDKLESVAKDEDEEMKPILNRGKSEDIHEPIAALSAEVLKDMLDTKNFLSKEVEVYEDAKPVSKDTEEESEEESSSKSSGLFSIFSKKDVKQSPSAPRKKHKKKKKQETKSPPATKSPKKGGFFSKIGEKVASKFEGAASEVKEVVDETQDGLKQKSKKVKGFAEEELERAKSSIEETKTTIKDGVEQGQKKTIDAAKNADEKLSTIKNGLEESKNLIVEDIEKQTSELKAASDASLQLAKDKLHETKSAVDEELQKTKDNLDDLKSSTVETLDKTKEASQVKSKQVEAAFEDQLTKVKDTLETKLTEAKDSVKSGLEAEKKAAEEKVQQAADVIDESFALGKDKLAKAKDEIEAKKSSLKSDLQGKLDEGEKSVKDAKTAFDDGLTKAEVKMEDTLTGITSVTESIKTGAAEKIHEGKLAVEDEAKKTKGVIEKGLMEGKQQLDEAKSQIDAHKKSIEESAEKSKSKIDETFTNIKGTIFGIKSEIKDKVDTSKKAIEEKSKDATTTIDDKLSSTQHEIEKRKESITTEIAHKLDDAKKAVDDKIKETKAKVETSIQDAKTDIGHKRDSGKAAVADKTEQANQLAKEVISSTKDQLQKAKNEIETTKKSVAQGIAQKHDEVKDKSKEAKTIAEQSIGVAQEKLTDVQEGIKEKVVSVTKSAEDKIKDAKIEADKAKQQIEATKDKISSDIQQKVGEVKEDIKEKIHATEEKLSGVKSKVELKAEEGKATLDSKAMEAMKKVDEVVITAKDKIQESKDKVDATKEDMKAKIAEEKKATDEKVKKAKGVAEETVIQAKGKLTQIKSEVEQKVEETKKDVEQKKKNLQTSAEEYVSETKEKLKDAESKIKAKTESIVSETEQKLEESKKMADEKAKQAKSALDSSIKSAKGQLADAKSEAAKKPEDTKKVLEDKSIEAKDSIESFKSGVAGMFADGKKAAQVKFEDTTAETEKCLFEARQVVEDKSKGAKALIDSKVESAKSATESFIEKEKKEVEDRREHAKSILKDVKSDVESKVEDGKKSLEEVKKEAKSVVDLAKEKSEEAKTVVSSSISTLKGKAEDTVSAGTAKAQDKVDGIKDKVDASLSSVRDEVKIAEDKIQSLNSGIKDESDKVKATVSEKLQEASSAMHETESKMKEGFTRIDEKFKDTKGVFEKSISDAISKTKEECEQGLLQKMDDSKQTIEKKVQDTKSSFSETLTSSKAKAEDKEKDFTSTIEHQFSQLLDDVKSEVDTIKTQKEQASSKLTSAEKDFQSRAHSLQTSVETKGSDVASNLSEVIDKEIANIEKSLQSIGGSSALQKGDKSQTPKAFEASLLESLDQVLEETKIQSTKAERKPEKESLFDILVQDIKGGKSEQPEIVTDLDDVRRSFSGELPQETLEALQAVDKQKADVVKLVQEQTASFSGKLEDEFESLDSDFLGRMKRTVSDFSGTKKKSDGNECSVNISETNIDLSSLPPMESEKRVSKQKEKGSSPYITSPTMSRRSVSQRLPKGERPELLDVTNMPLDSSSDEEQYIVTTPTDDKGTESRKRRPLFHIESEDDDSFDHDKRQDSVKSNVLETLSEATLETLVTNLGAESVDVEKDKGVQKVEEDSKVDVETIEQKLRDLDAALGSLESLEAQESKKEAKLKRVERKFERMASEALEKDETDKLTTPEVEEKRDTEFRTLVSQLSTEEISDFQKDYATLWDDQTFSRSEEMESKTPDSQAEIQELPKGEIVYMAPVNLNKDTLVNKAGIEVDVIPIMRSPCASPRHRRKKRKTARAKSEIAFGKSALKPEEDRGSLPDLDHYKNTPLKGSLMELVQTNPDRFLNRSCISGSTESLVSSIVSEDRMARSLGSSESLSRGAIMNAVVNWLHKSSPLGSLDNLDSGSNASLLTTSDVQDSETSRSCTVPEIFVSDVKGQVRSSKNEKRREPCLLSQSPLETSCGPLTQNATLTPSESELTPLMPKPKPRSAKSQESQLPLTSPLDEVSVENISEVSPVVEHSTLDIGTVQVGVSPSESLADTYSDRKKFWEAISGDTEITISRRKRMSLFEEPAIDRSLLIKKRTSIHDLPPVPKPRQTIQESDLSRQQSDSSGKESEATTETDISRIVEEDTKVMSEYQSRFKDPAEVLQTKLLQKTEMERVDSLDSEAESSSHQQGYENAGYISDSGDVEHYISDSEIEDRVPQIRERQMSIAIPVATTRKTIYERSASLPTEDLYEVSARSSKFRKQYYEEQIKKEMIEEQLTSDIEDEMSPERKALTIKTEEVTEEHDDLIHDSPKMKSHKDASVSVKELAKCFEEKEKVKEKSKIPVSVKTLAKGIEKELGTVIAGQKIGAPSKELKGFVVDKQLKEDHKSGSVDQVEDIKDFEEIVHQPEQFTEHKSFSVESDQSATSERSTRSTSIEEQKSQTSKPCDSMEVHIDKSELEYSEKIMDVDHDATDIEVRSLDSVNNTEASEIPEITVTLSGKQRRISEESDEYEDKKPTEPSVSPVREAESPIKQPEQKIEDVVWEVSVESGPIFEEHTDELREDYPRKESKDEDMSLSVREESDLGSEIHQDHSDSALSDKIKSESHSELEKIILDKLQQEKVDPVEAVRIANALITDIETEIGSREILKKPDPCLISEIETPHMSESLRQLVISKGLDKREVELVESVLARRHRELAKLGRVDTEASSMEITDEDLRFSGTEYDYSGMLEQQISELQRQKSAEDLKTVYDTLEKESHEKPEDVKSEKVYRESIKEERQSADTESVEGGKILAHKSDTQTKVTDSFRTERRTSDKKETIAEEDECISETSIEEVVSHTTKKEATVKQTDKMISGTKTEIQKATGHVEEDMKSEVKCVESEVEIKEGDSLKSEKITEQTEIEISKLSGKSEMEKKSEEKTELGSVESQTKTKHEVDHLQKSESKTDISRTKEVKTLEEGAEFEISQIHEKTHTSTKLITEDHTRAESILTSNKTLTDLSKEDITKLVTSGELPSDKEETIREVTTVHEVIKRTSSSESKSSHDDSTKSPDEQSTCSSGRKGDSDTTKTPEKHQEVVFRKVKQKYDADTSSSSGNLKFDRKSGMDFEAYSSSGESHYHSFELDSGKSRPCSSDVEGLVAAGSSEYESALTSQDVSAPSHITSTDYHTAVSSISSKESMKSLDSESSGNLASLEISEASETLVPSTFEVDEDVLKDDHERLPPMRQSTDFSDSEILSYPGESMEASDDDLLNESKSPETQPRMKRSQEMTFQPEPKALVPDSPQSEMGQEVEEKYGSSLDEGSVLSMSVSSTSSAAALRTVISRADSERLEGSMTISGTSEHLSLEDVDGSLIGSKENLMATTSTCTAPNVSDFTVESVSFHTSNVSEDGVFSASTQVTSVTKDIETNETAKKEVVTAKKRGHRRQDSTSSFVPSQMYTEVTKKLQEDLPEADMTHKESASDEKKDMDESESKKKLAYVRSDSNEISDVDVAEIKRSILQEVAEHKDIMEKRDSQSMLSNASSEKSSFEEGEAEAAFNMVAHVSPAHKVKQICPIMEDEDAEKHELEMREKAQKELEVRRQQMRDQSPSAIPDIKITQHMTASVDDEFTYTPDQKQKTEEVQDEPETPASTSSKSSVETDQGREYTLDDSGVTFPEEEKTEQTESKSELATVMEKTTCETDKETESSHSDSFEMVEKPDLIDDFVVIEEVAKEAHEFDTEGKTVKITAKKPTKKVDSEIEEYLKKSAPKATTTKKVTDAKYYPDSSSEELGFDFEESPPQPGQEKPAKGRDYVYEYDKELEANKKWIEQQFQGDHAAMMSAGYGYEMEFERAPLEDIKEEDINDFDPTSSRIGSLGSQKESGGSLGSVKDSFSSTPEYDVLAGRKYFTRSGEHDDVSMSSLQEFENLERAMSLENRRAHQGSQDSSSNGSFSKRYYASRSGQGDDVSVSSLKEFEGLEKACIAAHKIEIKVKEEEAMLTQIDEGQESITSESESCETISGKKVVADSDEEDYDKRMFEIDEIIRQAQTNVERFIDLKEGERTESIGRGDSVEEVAKVPDLELDAPIVRTTPKVQWADTEDVMATSTDSLELKQEKPSHHDSTDSLEQKTAADIMTASTDSIEFQAQKAKELIMSDSIETKEDLDRLVSSDSLELATGTNFANLSDSIDEDGSRVGIYDQSSSSGKDISMAKEECVEYKIRPEHMLGSTDSLDPSSSTATHATYQYETDSVFSGSFTSGGSNTMVSSTDTIEQATNVIDLAAAVRKVWFDDDSEAAARQFTTEYVHDGSKPYVTEVIEPCEDDDEFSHRIHRKVELPPEVRKITFTGADANEQLKRFVEGFGEGETVEETEEVDSDGNVHVKRVVQKRYLIHGEKGVTKRVVNDDKGTKTIYSQEIGEAGEDTATAVQSLLKSIAGDTGDGSWQSSPTTASDVLGATPRRPQDESKQGTTQQKASDQHQLSEEMKELLKEMEKDAKK